MTEKKRGVHFCFTHNFVEDIEIFCANGVAFDKIEEWLESQTLINYMIFKKEQGEKTQRFHYQGYFQIHPEKQKTQLQMVKYVPFLSRATIIASRGSDEDNVNYVTKLETSVANGNVFKFGIKRREQRLRIGNTINKFCDMKEDANLMSYIDFVQKYSIINKNLERLQNLEGYYNLYRDAYKYDLLDEFKELLPWQNEVIDMIRTKPDNRVMYWIYDSEGNKGKSMFALHLIGLGDAFMFRNGKTSDIALMLKKRLQRGTPLCVIYDCTRSVQEERFNYEIMEMIKDGCVQCGKYESVMIQFRRPHFFVFSNAMPDVSRLSLDRWHIYEITNMNQLKIIDNKSARNN